MNLITESRVAADKTMTTTPKHIAIIPDGNRRWAKRQGQPAFFGHQAGAEAIEKVLEAALEHRIPFMTIWGCSVANITERDRLEVHFLFSIFETYFKKLADSTLVKKNKIRIRVLGEWPKYFPVSCQNVIKELVESTAAHTEFQLTFLLAYSGKAEMLSAVQSMVDLGYKNNAVVVDEARLKQHLATRDLPAVDLVIRTGGEPHFSTGFMMWDVAEARLYFTAVLWPDFSPAEFKKALEYYAEVERRAGK